LLTIRPRQCFLHPPMFATISLPLTFPILHYNFPHGMHNSSISFVHSDSTLANTSIFLCFLERPLWCDNYFSGTYVPISNHNVSYHSSLAPFRLNGVCAIFPFVFGNLGFKCIHLYINIWKLSYEVLDIMLGFFAPCLLT
jgi:hypothetical protein